jgi:hypothetical protein
MRRILLIVAVFSFAMTLGVVPASADNDGRSHSFRWFRDADGDGIPNGIDEDWIHPKDGAGNKLRHSFGTFVGVSLTAGGDKVRHQYHLQYQERFKKPVTTSR